MKKAVVGWYVQCATIRITLKKHTEQCNVLFLVPVCVLMQCFSWCVHESPGIFITCKFRLSTSGVGPEILLLTRSQRCRCCAPLKEARRRSVKFSLLSSMHQGLGAFSSTCVLEPLDCAFQVLHHKCSHPWIAGKNEGWHSLFYHRANVRPDQDHFIWKTHTQRESLSRNFLEYLKNSAVKRQLRWTQSSRGAVWLLLGTLGTKTGGQATASLTEDFSPDIYAK